MAQQSTQGGENTDAQADQQHPHEHGTHGAAR
jgi:hypothetical protein